MQDYYFNLINRLDGQKNKKKSKGLYHSDYGIFLYVQVLTNFEPTILGHITGKKKPNRVETMKI